MKHLRTAVTLTALAAFTALQLRRWQTTAPAAPTDTAAPPALPVTPERVSVLVPGWKAANDLPPFMEAFRALTHPNLQLVLCVGGPDGSLELARRLAPDHVVLEQRPGEGKQKALERSLEESDGDVILLTDIDCRLTDDVVQALLGTLHASGGAAVTGASMPLRAQLSIPLVRSHYATEVATLPGRAEPVDGLLGRSAAVRRDALKGTRAFSVPAPSGTDYTLAKVLAQAGHRITFAPGPRIESEYPDTVRVYAHKQARWLRNAYLLGRRYGAEQEVRAVQRTLAVPFVLSGLLLASPLFPPLAVLAACCSRTP